MTSTIQFLKTKVLTILLFSFSTITSLHAQKLIVVNFEAKPFDNTAYTQPRKDYNDEFCALVKVRFPKEGATFEGKVFGDPLFKVNEYWVYMPKGAKHLGCHIPGYEYLDVVFTEYNIHSLQTKVTYVLDLKGNENKGLESVEKGDPEVMLRQAKNYEKGIGTYAKDLAHAKHWYEQAAQAGNAEAQVYLAEVCFEGKNGYQQDFYEAFRWHKECAQRGNVESYYALGQMYAYGKGTTANKREAINWLKKYNAERNHPEAQLLLANLLGQRDPQGISYYKRAADNGIAEAMYKYAEAVKSTDKEICQLYFHKASQLGYPPTISVEEKTTHQQQSNVKTVATSTQSAQTSVDDDYEWLSKRRITANDLLGKSKAELRILRNAIFARHGYKFKSADLKAHFSKFSWYQPHSSDVSAQLNSIEQANIQFIKSYE